MTFSTNLHSCSDKGASADAKNFFNCITFCTFQSKPNIFADTLHHTQCPSHNCIWVLNLCFVFAPVPMDRCSKQDCHNTFPFVKIIVLIATRFIFCQRSFFENALLRLLIPSPSFDPKITLPSAIKLLPMVRTPKRFELLRNSCDLSLACVVLQERKKILSITGRLAPQKQRALRTGKTERRRICRHFQNLLSSMS
jgi:hypothetical protein